LWSDFTDFLQGYQIGFFEAKVHKFGFFRGSWCQKNCLAFWFFPFNIWLFWRQLTQTIRLVFGFLNTLLKSVIRLFQTVLGVFSQKLPGNPLKNKVVTYQT